MANIVRKLERFSGDVNSTLVRNIALIAKTAHSLVKSPNNGTIYRGRQLLFVRHMAMVTPVQDGLTLLLSLS